MSLYNSLGAILKGTAQEKPTTIGELSEQEQKYKETLAKYRAVVSPNVYTNTVSSITSTNPGVWQTDSVEEELKDPLEERVVALEKTVERLIREYNYDKSG